MNMTRPKYKRISEEQRIKDFVAASVAHGYANRTNLTRTEVYEICDESGLPYPRWLAKDPDRRLSRGKYAFPELAEAGESIMNVSPGHETEGDGLGDYTTIEEQPEEELTFTTI